MPISTLDPRALSRLSPQQVADMMLQLDQERRHYDSIGAASWSADCQAELDRLERVFQAA